MTSNVIIREARRKDCSAMFQLVKDFANFENMPGAVKIDSKTLESAGFDSPKPMYHCLVAEDTDCENTSKLVGMIFFNYGYSSWHGKTLYLSSIYITKNYRSKGLGTGLFRRMCQIAMEENCQVMYFTVLKWNPATKFYKSFGAKDLTETDKWHVYSMQKEHFSKVGHVKEL